MALCINCNEKEAVNKKRTLCAACYQRLRKENKLAGLQDSNINQPIIVPINDTADPGYLRSKKEFIFIKSYFTHNNWMYEPVTFNLDHGKYTPDFYDGERNVFIEVVGSRQAYHINKDKYNEFKNSFKNFRLEFRLIDGTLLDTDSDRLNFNGCDRPLETLKEMCQ